MDMIYLRSIICLKFFFLGLKIWQPNLCPAAQTPLCAVYSSAFGLFSCRLFSALITSICEVNREGATYSCELCWNYTEQSRCRLFMLLFFYLAVPPPEDPGKQIKNSVYDKCKALWELGPMTECDLPRSKEASSMCRRLSPFSPQLPLS